MVKQSVDLPFRFGETVYHRCHHERRPGLVTGFILRPSGLLISVSWGDRSETDHFDYELVSEYEPDYTAD